MTVYDFDTYKAYVKSWVSSLPSNGRGEYRRISEYLNVNTTLLSQIFNGPRELNEDQALQLTEYLGFNENESEFFLLLVSKERSGTEKLKNYYKQKLATLKSKAEAISHRVGKDKDLEFEDQAIFYSEWYYSAIRLFCLLHNGVTFEAISSSFKIPKTKIKSALDFLVSRGLLKKENDLFKMGPKSTHLPASSPLISRHHSNWRQRAIEASLAITEDELMFTSPMTISIKDAKKVRKMLLECIDSACRVIDDSPSEELMCLNIDLFKIQR